MPDTTTIYVTKGAETHGIRAAEIIANMATDAGTKAVARTGAGVIHFLDRGDYFQSFDEAAVDAEIRRNSAVASLMKIVAAMEAIDLTKVREG